MTQQTLPFFESAEEATQHAIQAAGLTPKQVACALWPDKGAEAAATLLRNCLNQNREERLTSDQHLFIANHTGHYAWLHYCAHRCHHSRPEPVSPQDDYARRQEEFIAAVEQLSSIQKHLDAAKSRTLRSVS